MQSEWVPAALVAQLLHSPNYNRARSVCSQFATLRAPPGIRTRLGVTMSITTEHAEDARWATWLHSGKGVRPLAGLLISLSVAACAQSPSVTGKSELLTGSRQASLSDNRKANKRRAVTLAREARPTEASVSSVGLASYYSEGTRTASGERFNPEELTAAHPTLPFGTRLRVTNLSTGRSVVVRVNDRGPFVPGRVVDVSYSAAASLGMTEKGTAKVKLDVVQ